ncbi:hypothetical protein [Actinosynnema sp. NPDC023587]|uniref:hypothetical protein n=1 Tax=Actinosynnema sp. NPDC023587 TaxID=3154695 RepID=UPI0033CB49CF
MHDLLRAYATDLAATDPERELAVTRLVDHYATAFHDTHLWCGGRPTASNRFAGVREVLAWTGRERSVLGDAAWARCTA